MFIILTKRYITIITYLPLGFENNIQNQINELMFRHCIAFFLLSLLQRFQHYQAIYVFFSKIQSENCVVCMLYKAFGVLKESWVDFTAFRLHSACYFPKKVESKDRNYTLDRIGSVINMLVADSHTLVRIFCI